MSLLQHRFVALGSQDRIGSPFGGMLDLMDYTSKPHPTPITSALPTVSSSSKSTSTFDMTLLKMEVPSKHCSCTKSCIILSPIAEATSTQVYTANAKGLLSEPIKQPFVPNDLRVLLGLEELMLCSDTYSRKVFVGGLPSEIDEGEV